MESARYQTQPTMTLKPTIEHTCSETVTILTKHRWLSIGTNVVIGLVEETAQLV